MVSVATWNRRFVDEQPPRSTSLRHGGRAHIPIVVVRANVVTDLDDFGIAVCNSNRPRWYVDGLIIHGRRAARFVIRRRPVPLAKSDVELIARQVGLKVL